MVIFELPAHRRVGDLRAWALGSCRVRNPLFVLRDRGDLRIRADGPTPTHTAAEALQSLAIVMGECAIPEGLHSLIFESEHRPAIDRLARTQREGIDVFLLEISDDRQFTYGDILLNQNFVSRHLVQAQRGALLDWYREISRGSFAEETTVETALAKLREGGFRHDEQMASLLRGIRLERCEARDVAATLEAMAAKMGGRWIVVGPFATPGDEGDIMRRRRVFNGTLSEAAARCGAVFYDPSRLLVQHGRAVALAGGGADIYEYAESFYPTVGEALVELVRSVGPPRGRQSQAPPIPASLAAESHPHLVRAGWAIRLEAIGAKFTKRVRRQIRRLGRGIAKLGRRA